MMLNLTIWLPLLTGACLLALPLRNRNLVRWLATTAAALPLVMAIVMFVRLRAGHSPGFENRLWIESIGLGYSLGLSRTSILLIILATLIGLCAVLVSWNVQKRPKEFFGLMLLMTGGITGAFASLDLFFFYIFHEIALIPTFLLIGYWGGPERRRAALKMTLFLGGGSLVLLAGLVGLYSSMPEPRSFYIPSILDWFQKHPLPEFSQEILFAILFVGFATLVSVVPLHTWAPSGYAEAPPAAAMIHAGILKKFGIYGLIVVAIPMLPAGYEAFRFSIGVFGVLTILYAGYIALKQTDLNRMLGYSSVSHMGYAFLGLAGGSPVAMEGVVFLMLAHGLSASLGFALAGCSFARSKTREMPVMGGLAGRMPVAASLFTMAALAGCGLPGLGNFVAELLVFLGTVKAFPVLTALAVWGVVISATYLIRATKRIYLGPMPDRYAEVTDLTWQEKIPCFLLVGVLLCIGLFPRLITDGVDARPPDNPRNWVHHQPERPRS